MPPTAPVASADLVILDQEPAGGLAGVIGALAARLHAAGRVDDADSLTEAVLAREALGSTALPSGVAMPHARSAAVRTTSIAVARLPEPLALEEDAEPVRLVLLIAAGADPESYLDLLQRVAGACVKGSFIADLLEAESAERIAELVRGAVERP